MRTILANRGTRIWMVITALFLILLIVANIVMTSVLSGLMNTMFGGDRQVRIGTTGNDYFTASDGVVDKASAMAAGNALVERISDEGFILLKNDGGVLPLTTSANAQAKVTVFGKNSVNLVYGSAGSVGADASKAKTIFDSLTAANFEFNPVMKSFYEGERSGSKRPTSPSMASNSIVTGFATGEPPVSAYSDSEINSFAQYNDAAIVVISRTSGENYDLPLTMKNTEGAMDETDHYLELDQNEQEMLKLACENFEKVILVINSATPIELGFLDGADDGDVSMIAYDFSDKIKAAVWIGMPGETGIMALGRILSGEVNPSGRTVDTYARDFLSIPSVTNFSCNGQENVDRYSCDGAAQRQYFIDYEEGIYIGYKYFETRGADEGEDWYGRNVVYPFGYGLSYTSFEQKITNTSIEPNSAWQADTKNISVTVTVTNTGDRPGKDVVQLYVTPPYTPGSIEKSHKVLIGYGKTEEIPAGESMDVTINFDAYDLASYDYSDANGNGFRGYELEAGSYVFTVGKNAHEAYDSVETMLATSVRFETDIVTGTAVVNRFDDLDDQLGSVLSRADWEGTMPQMRTDAEKNVSSDFLASLDNRDSGNPLTATAPQVVEALERHPYATIKDEEGMKLYELIGIEYDTDDRDMSARWDEMISRLTLSTIWDTLSDAAFKSPAINYIMKPETIDTDGPAGFVKFMGVDNTVFDTCFYMSECILAATWNDELAYEMGVAIGDEGLIGNANSGVPYSGWYAPAVNLHRTPFGGRNPEYYSEDPVLSGGMGAKVIAGAMSRGIYPFVKHFVANEQETHRGGVCTWLTEQALRENYLKSFEIAVKDGGSTALMTSFNRIGSTWTGGDYRLVTEVLRNEWGFKGTVICDFASGQGHMDFKQMLYAGGDLWLDTIAPTKWYSADNPMDVYVMQEGIKHVLYTVANSNAMVGIGEGAVYETHMAYWRIALIAVDVLIPVLLAIWGFAAISGARKRQFKAKTSQ